MISQVSQHFVGFTATQSIAACQADCQGLGTLGDTYIKRLLLLVKFGVCW